MTKGEQALLDVHKVSVRNDPTLIIYEGGMVGNALGQILYKQRNNKWNVTIEGEKNAKELKAIILRLEELEEK